MGDFGWVQWFVQFVFQLVLYFVVVGQFGYFVFDYLLFVFVDVVVGFGCIDDGLEDCVVMYFGLGFWQVVDGLWLCLWCGVVLLLLLVVVGFVGDYFECGEVVVGDCFVVEFVCFFVFQQQVDGVGCQGFVVGVGKQVVELFVVVGVGFVVGFVL